MPNYQQQAPQMMQTIAPDIAAQQVALQRQQQIADMLRQQSLTPIGNTEMLSGFAVKQSPLLAISKILQAGVGGYMQNKNDEKGLELGKAMQGRMADILNGGQNAPGQAIGGGLTQDGQAPNNGTYQSDNGALIGDNGGQSVPVSQPQAAPAQNNFNMANLLKGQVIDSMGGSPAASAYWDNMKRTDSAKRDSELGIGQDSSRASELAKRLKEGYIAPVNARPGSILRDPMTNKPIAYNPQIPEGATPSFDASGNVIGMSPIKGALESVSALEGAKVQGKNRQTLASPEMSPMNPQGQPIPTSIDQTLNGGFPASSPIPMKTNAGTMQQGQSDQLSILQQERQNPRNTAQDNAALDREIARAAPQQRQGVGMPLGLPASVAGNVKTVNDHFEGMNAANANAPVELDALRNIKQYAKGAITGAASDKREFMNGLGSLIPGFDSSMDAKTQTDLLNKNAARMTLAGASSAGATDALRTLAAASNPNNHMSQAAINDAVDQITSIKKMNLAAQSILEPLKLNNNTQTYQQTLSQFNKVADPKLFQYKDLAGTPEGQAFLKKAIKNDPQFLQKAKALHDMGAY